MTSLDQALIRAFQQQGGGTVAVPPVPPAAAQNVSRAAETRRETPQRFKPATIAELTRQPEPAPALSLSDVFSGVLAALEKTPSGPSVSASDEKPSDDRPETIAIESARPPVAMPATVPLRAEAAPSRALGEVSAIPIDQRWALGDQQCVVGVGPWDQGVSQWATAIELPIQQPEYRATSPAPSIPQAEPRFPSRELDHDSRTLSRAPEPEIQTSRIEARTASPELSISNRDFQAPSSEYGAPSAPAPVAHRPLRVAPQTDFRPAWQVDRFTWPRICRRLMSRAGDEWGRLCDALLAAGERGQKVLALAGCRRGEGATTLLLCAASQLAERGIKTVLVDADIRRPRLAKRLGIQAQTGWDDGCDADGSGLDRAMIESTASGLAVLPLCESPARNGRETLDWPRLAACLERLRYHYEVVLIDLGPLESVDWAAGMPAWATASDIDSLLLVCNRRMTSDEQLSEVQRRLSAAGMPLAGLIENFSRTDEPCTNPTGD